MKKFNSVSKPEKEQIHLNVLIVGLMNSPNLGDMVIAECLKALLEKRNCTVSFLSADGRTETQKILMNKVASVAHRDQRKVLLGFMPESLIAYFAWRQKKHRAIRSEWTQRIENSDLVIVGGGNLITNGSVPRVSKVIDIAYKHTKPIAIFSIGVKPGLDFTAKLILRKALTKTFWASARSRDSSAILENLYSNGKCEVTPDPAIFSNFEYPMRHLVKQPSIGFNLENLVDLKEYLQLQKMSQNDLELRLVSTIQAVASSGYIVNLFTNGDPRDQQFAEALFQQHGLHSLGVKLATRPTSTRELVSLVEQNALNVCFRLHASIVSLSLGIPFLVFPWDAKVIDVMTLFGQTACVVDPSFWEEREVDRRLTTILSSLGSSPALNSDLYGVVGDHLDIILCKARSAIEEARL